MLKRIAITLLFTPVLANAQNPAATDWPSNIFGSFSQESRSDSNSYDQTLRDLNALVQQQEEQAFRERMLDQQQRMIDLMEQQTRNQPYQNPYSSGSYTTNCQPDGLGGVRCTTR